MWKLIGSIVEMFVYSAVYLIIALISTKIVGAVFSTDFEKKISEEGNVGLSLICACIFISLAILLSMVIR